MTRDDLLDAGLSVIEIPTVFRDARVCVSDPAAPHSYMRFALWPFSESMRRYMQEYGIRTGYRLYCFNTVKAALGVHHG